MKKQAAMLILIFGLSADAASPTVAGAPASPGGEQPAVPINLTRADMEHFLRTARIIKIKPLKTGVTHSKRATLSDGRLTHDAHIQSIDKIHRLLRGTEDNEINFLDSYRYNIAAYLLDKVLGLDMVPVTVERKVGGRTSAVTWWVDDVLMSEQERLKKRIQPPNSDNWIKQGAIVRVFDQLIYNIDRNLGNLLITKDWKLWMIDHTRAFRNRKNLRRKENLTRCDRKLLAKLRQLNEPDLRRQLRPYLTKSGIRALLIRRDKMVKFFEEKIAGQGETAALYDYLEKREPQP